MTRSSPAWVVSLMGILLFWAGVLGAGALVDGYSVRSDYISSLAGRGSPVALLAIAALLASAVAHVATSYALRTAWHSRWCAAFVLASAVATAVVAGFRQSCPEGPAGCAGADSGTNDWVDTVHGTSVAVYELFILAAMAALVARALRGGAAGPRWLGWASVLFAVGSVLLVGRIEGDDLGLWQRLWVANNQVWLLLVAWTAAHPRPTRPHS